MLGEEMGNYVKATTTESDESDPETRRDQLAPLTHSVCELERISLPKLK